MSAKFRHVLGFNFAIGFRCLRCLRTVADIVAAEGSPPLRLSHLSPCAFDITWPDGRTRPGGLTVPVTVPVTVTGLG